MGSGFDPCAANTEPVGKRARSVLFGGGGGALGGPAGATCGADVGVIGAAQGDLCIGPQPRALNHTPQAMFSLWCFSGWEAFQTLLRAGGINSVQTSAQNDPTHLCHSLFGVF